MAAFLNDTFTEASTTALASHTPETGGAWAKHPSFGASIEVVGGAGHARGVSGSSALYYNSAAPGSADYYVEAVVDLAATTDGFVGLLGRVSTSAATMYQVYYDNDASEWTLQAMVDGGSAGLGSYPVSFTPGSPVTIRLEMIGSAIKFYLDGTLRISATSTHITAAGRGGIRGRLNGIFLSVSAEDASADTTAPILTSPTGTQTGPTTATVGATTDEGNGTLYAVVTASATAPSVAQIKAGQNESGAAAVWGGSVAVSSTGAKTLNATGLTASTSYYAHLVHADSAGNNSNVVSSAQFATAAGADTTLPTLTGTITISSLTTTSYTASWPAGSDNVAVTGYEYRINAGTWVDNGNSLSVGISGRTPGSTDTFEVRAYDAAGNRSTPALSQSVTLNTTAVGTVTVGSALYPIRNASSTVLDESSIRVSVVRADTLEQVYHGPGHAITAGVLAVSDAAIVAGTAYHVSVKTAAGWIGMSDQVIAT